MQMTDDAFSRFHPAVNFAFFTLALLSAMLFTDCAHIAGSAVAAAAYLLILYRRRGLRTLFTLQNWLQWLAVTVQIVRALMK